MVYLSEAYRKEYRLKPVPLKSVVAIILILAGAILTPSARAQQSAATPESALSDALSAACRQDATEFANFLTSDTAKAYRSLAAPQRTAFMKRFVQLEDTGRTLLSTGTTGHLVLRCETPSIETEMRFAETRLRENLAFVPMEIPLPGDASRSVTFGLVREGGSWKLLSVGLILLDIPAMEKQWEQADMEEREDKAIAGLRTLATALESYRAAYGKLPDTLAPLGPAADGLSPDAAGLVDTALASGNKDGYTIRYIIVPASGDLSDEEANEAETFGLAATPNDYGKTGRRSFYLDSVGLLRGAYSQCAIANSTDPRIGPA